MKEYIPNTIYCPQCKKKALVWDGRATMQITATCKECNKRVAYDPLTGKVELKEIPQRWMSSGCRFY